jgi:Cu/Ag efflux protein CusF
MRKLMIAAGAIALLGAVSAASAGEAVGVITGVDASANSITLSNGRTFSLANVPNNNHSSLADNFKPGDKVHVIYQQLNGQPTATQITPRG